MSPIDGELSTGLLRSRSTKTGNPAFSVNAPAAPASDKLTAAEAAIPTIFRTEFILTMTTGSILRVENTRSYPFYFYHNLNATSRKLDNYVKKRTKS